MSGDSLPEAPSNDDRWMMMMRLGSPPVAVGMGVNHAAPAHGRCDVVRTDDG